MSTMAGKACASCGRLTNTYVEFKCPKCSETTFYRCFSCREKHTRYKCHKCEFEGP